MNIDELTEEEFQQEVTRVVYRMEPRIRKMMIRSMKKYSVEFSINVAMDLCTSVIAMSMCTVKQSGADPTRIFGIALKEIARKITFIESQAQGNEAPSSTHLH